jgi:hypothetical protein
MRIDFVDFWPNFIKNDNYFYHLLNAKYDIIIDVKQPDLVFMSCYGTEKDRYKDHNCHKIFFTGENRGLQCVVNGTWSSINYDYDLTLTFEPTGQKNFYLPLIVLFINWFNIPHKDDRDISWLADIDDLKNPARQPKTRSCCFLARNPNARERVEFCKEAMKYFRVDCPGLVLNNCPPIGGRGDQIHKINFLKKYKLNIAFENSKASGYFTEKLLHAVACKCVPIYWGANNVLDYVNAENFILVNEPDDWPIAIDRAKRVLAHDYEYFTMVKSPALLPKFWNDFDPAKILEVILDATT